jgi:glycosyltransferase involved in cell wall biosynthesis
MASTTSTTLSSSTVYDCFGRHRVPARAARQADVVIAGNAYLADWASEHAKRVVVIPSCVATDIVSAKTDYVSHDAPRICWIGSHSTESYLIDIGSALLDVHRQTGARIRLIGSPTGNLPASLESMVDRIPWNADTWATEAASCDVGIMPVPDDAWAKGKCGYKLIQYGALGLPVVGTAVGVNSEILSRLGGLAPASASEWVSALTDYLGQSDARREAIGRQARRAVEKYYSFDAHAASFVETVFPTGLPASSTTASSSVPGG